MPSQPCFIEFAEDTSSHDHRQNCLAWWLVTTKSSAELTEYVNKQKHLKTDEFRDRLERCLAWWMLTRLNLAQVHADLLAMNSGQAERMRAHLNQLRADVKKIRRTHSDYKPVH